MKVVTLEHVSHVGNIESRAVFSKACENYRMRKLSNDQYRMQLRNLILEHPWRPMRYPVCDNFRMRYSYSIAKCCRHLKNLINQ